MIEPYLGNDSDLYSRGWWSQILDYACKNYIEPYHSVYFEWYGKPLILAFNPIGLAYRPSDPRFTVRIVGNDIGNAGYQDLGSPARLPYTMDERKTRRAKD